MLHSKTKQAEENTVTLTLKFTQKMLFNPFSPAWHLRDAIQNAKETYIKDVRIERVKSYNTTRTLVRLCPHKKISYETTDA
jgi:hypothetical protein